MSRRCSRQFAFLVALHTAALGSVGLLAQEVEQSTAPIGAVSTPVGPRNPPLHDGAQALQAGLTEEGVRLTLEGLSLAQGNREEEAALSNLCAGYLRLRQFAAGLKYCNLLLERNENAWRAYNTRAMIYLELKDFENADRDLTRAEAINPAANTLKIARALYMDAVHPVAPEVEIDDRNASGAPESGR